MTSGSVPRWRCGPIPGVPFIAPFRKSCSLLPRTVSGTRGYHGRRKAEACQYLSYRRGGKVHRADPRLENLVRRLLQSAAHRPQDAQTYRNGEHRLEVFGGPSFATIGQQAQRFQHRQRQRPRSGIIWALRTYCPAYHSREVGNKRNDPTACMSLKPSGAQNTTL